MKKMSTRSVLVIFLVMASLSSYIFLSTVDTAPEAVMEDMEVISHEGTELGSPEMTLLNVFINVSRKILEAAQ